MNLLVTGSSGWLGRFLVPLLRKNGHTTIGLDPAPGSFTDKIGSVADRDTVTELFASHNFDGVIHAGALHKPDIARYPLQSFIDVNVTGTLNLLEEAAAKPRTRFIFTSTTSLMISKEIREQRSDEAVWLDEDSVPIEPRNIYGVTKLAAEGLCRQHHLTTGIDVVVLRTARFFPEDDDTITEISGPNLKANELLHRRATVQDIARAHLAAIEGAEGIGFGLFLVSAPTPFRRADARELKSDPSAVIERYYPDAPNLYRQYGWKLPSSIGRVYDGSLITRKLGFEYETKFHNLLESLRNGDEPPIRHDATYTSPLAEAAN